MSWVKIRNFHPPCRCSVWRSYRQLCVVPALCRCFGVLFTVENHDEVSSSSSSRRKFFFFFFFPLPYFQFFFLFLFGATSRRVCVCVCVCVYCVNRSRNFRFIIESWLLFVCLRSLVVVAPPFPFPPASSEDERAKQELSASPTSSSYLVFVFFLKKKERKSFLLQLDPCRTNKH